MGFPAQSCVPLQNWSFAWVLGLLGAPEHGPICLTWIPPFSHLFLPLKKGVRVLFSFQDYHFFIGAFSTPSLSFLNFSTTHARESILTATFSGFSCSPPFRNRSPEN